MQHCMLQLLCILYINVSCRRQAVGTIVFYNIIITHYCAWSSSEVRIDFRQDDKITAATVLLLHTYRTTEYVYDVAGQRIKLLDFVCVDEFLTTVYLTERPKCRRTAAAETRRLSFIDPICSPYFITYM